MPRFHGKGIMNEAFAKVTNYGFTTLKIRRLAGWVHHENIRSISLLSKCNFTRDKEEEEKAGKIDPIAIGLGNMLIYTLDAANYY
jgi:RimJ/RimL family protein N-acetyltransferase